MPTYTQDSRPMRINTSLGANVLLLEGFEGTEAISTPYLFTASLLSEKPDVAPADLLRKPVAIAMTTASGEDRFFHGMVRRFSQLGRIDALTTYRMEIVPAFWFATLSADCRVFQKMTVLEIIELLFGEIGVTDFAIRTTKSYPKREYCVQYRESHFAFISRLMEEEGIFYFFDHTVDKHVMVLADGTSAIKPCPTQAKVRVTAEAKAPLGEDVVLTWEKAQEIRTGKVLLTDYNFTQPSLNLLATADGAGAPERFDYPGQYETLDEGQRYATLQLEGAEAGGTTVSGTGTARAFTAGFKFDLREHYRRDSNGAYLLTSVKHLARAGDFRNWNNAPFDYSNSFTAMPAATVYRPVPVTPRPRVYGTLPAVVTGPSGEEIYVDQYGRVKIQFFWDRRGKRDEKSSCWVRVSTFWAGKTWGAVHIPRIGQEVVVGFLEGNPDEPVIVGSLYNAEQMPPYGLPDAKVKAGVKSDTHKGGGYNELSFDDTAGKEQITIHAQYDMGTTVLHDQTNTIQNNRTDVVNGTHTETIKKDTAVTVTEGNFTFKVNTGTADYTVKGKVTETFQDAQSTTVNKAITITSETATISLDAAEQITLHTGDSTITLKKNGEIKVHGKKIEIIGDDEVKISAPKVAISGGQEAKIGVGSQQMTLDPAKVNVSGAAINSSAVGMHEIAGALVKIN
jgi:type VI secretion system secreted protein VgrG